MEFWMTFQKQLGISSSQLTFIFFGGVAQPPTSSCFTMVPSGNQVWQAPCTDVVPESLYLSSANPIMIHHSISFHRFWNPSNTPQILINSPENDPGINPIFFPWFPIKTLLKPIKTHDFPSKNLHVLHGFSSRENPRCQRDSRNAGPGDTLCFRACCCVRQVPAAQMSWFIWVWVKIKPSNNWGTQFWPIPIFSVDLASVVVENNQIWLVENHCFILSYL